MTLPAGGDYGDRKALAELQSAAPMSPQQTAGGGVPPGAAARGGTPDGGGSMPGAEFGRNVFSPSLRPGEPVTSGIDLGAGLGAPPRRDLSDDRMLLLKVLFERNPSPQLARVLASVSTRRAR